MWLLLSRNICFKGANYFLFLESLQEAPELIDPKLTLSGFLRSVWKQRSCTQSHSCTRVPEQLLSRAAAPWLASPVQVGPSGADSKPDLSYLDVE